MDLPRINYEKANAKKYRYVYGTRIFTNDPAVSQFTDVSPTSNPSKQASKH